MRIVTSLLSGKGGVGGGDRGMIKTGVKLSVISLHLLCGLSIRKCAGTVIISFNGEHTTELVPSLPPA